MGDLLKRELNMNENVQQQGPRRQPLYVTPKAAGTKGHVKEVDKTKLESSLAAWHRCMPLLSQAGEVWDANESKSNPRVFARMKNAAFLVSKIGEITEEIQKECCFAVRALKGCLRQEKVDWKKKKLPTATMPVSDECNFSLRKFRKRLADEF